LVARGIDINRFDKRKWSPIHQVIYDKNLEMVKLFVESGANLKKNNQSGFSCLTSAIERGKYEIVEYLITSGIDINQLDGRQWSPIHQAIINGKTNAVKLLICKGAKLDHNNPNGYSCLTSAIERGNQKIVEHLVASDVIIDKVDHTWAKGGGRGGVHPWVKKFFWSTPEVKKYGGAASLGWRRGSAAENFLTLPCNSRSKNGEKWTLPRVKWVPPPSKIGADSLKMAKVPRELAPQVKNFPAAEGGRQIFDIAPWELTPQVTFFACPCMSIINLTIRIFK
jgi:hypothetical protein